MKIFIITLLFSTQLLASDILVSRFVGNVTVDGEGAREGQVLSVGQKVKAKGLHSFFQLTYSNGSQVLVKDGTLIIYKNEAALNSVKLLKGTSFFSIEREAKEKFKIYTRFASFRAKKSKFTIQSNSNEAHICVFKGAVVARNKAAREVVMSKEELYMTKFSVSESTDADEDALELALAGFDLMGTPLN